jgi:hypothetical protein
MPCTLSIRIFGTIVEEVEDWFRKVETSCLIHRTRGLSLFFVGAQADPASLRDIDIS